MRELIGEPFVPMLILTIIFALILVGLCWVVFIEQNAKNERKEAEKETTRRIRQMNNRGLRNGRGKN